MQDTQFKKENNTRKFNVGAKAYAEGDKGIKEKPGAQWNKGNGAVRVRPHPAKFPTCDRNVPKDFSDPKKHQQIKVAADVTQGGQRSPQVDKQTWEHWSNSSGFRTKTDT